MHRRQFIETAVVGALALGLPGASSLAAPVPDLHALARPGLLTMLGEAPVRAIGRRYREGFPEASDAAALRTAILVHGESGPAHPGWLQQQIHDDFAAGRTVLLDGWMLSITEARQCALFSLLYP